MRALSPLAAVLALAGSSLLAAPRSSPAPRCVGIFLRSAAPGEAWRLAPRFSAREILDVDVRILFPAGRAPEEVDVRYTTPNGHLYQSLSVPVSDDGRVRPRPTHPFGVSSARSAPRSYRGQRVIAVEAPSLPVAGTHIVTNSLYGRWTVEAQAAGGAVCRANFTLDP